MCCAAKQHVHGIIRMHELGIAAAPQGFIWLPRGGTHRKALPTPRAPPSAVPHHALSVGNGAGCGDACVHMIACNVMRVQENAGDS